MTRASDDTRERTVAILRKGLITGRLGPDTFVERVEAAYRAKTHDDLAPITQDLDERKNTWRALIQRLARDAGAQRSDLPVVLRPPPMREGDRRTIGRSPTCDYRIDDPSVSGSHAEIVRGADEWTIHDLCSRNGTRVNGWLVREAELLPGDTLTLGASVFVWRPRD